MALPPLATIHELERRLGDSISDPQERDRAAALLTDASTLVRHEAGRTWVDAEGVLTAVPDIIGAIVLASAMRAWFNPAGVESTQLGATSIRFPDVWLTGTERDRIKGLISAGAGSGIVSVDMSHGFGWEGLPEGYVPVDYGQGQAATADPFPIGY